jgi:hypothetical protein
MPTDDKKKIINMKLNKMVSVEMSEESIQISFDGGGIGEEGGGGITQYACNFGDNT